jgi:hypothetical protein
MRPFEATLLPIKAFDRYPSPAEFLAYLESINYEEREGYLRQQVTEGIPYVFLSNPLLYEVIREWLSRELDIHSKEITLIGSARLGFSMSPAPDFGRPYKETSDLDLTIVSSKLFKLLAETFLRWKSEYEAKVVEANNPREEGYWKDNSKRVPQNLTRGFIDTYKIPNIYPASQHVNDTLSRLSKKLKATENYQGTTRTSARVYMDWQSFSRQLMLNLRHALEGIDVNYRKLLEVKEYARLDFRNIEAKN